MSDNLLILRVAGDILRRAGAVRVLNHAGVGDLMAEAASLAGVEAPAASAHASTRFADRLAKAGLLVRAQKDLYASLAADPPVHPNELACHLRDGAVVGLHTVLGERGIAHNPSRVVTAILPSSSRVFGAPRTVSTGMGDYRFVGMREDVFLAGAPEDRLDPESRYPRNTAERAFCDWLYLSTRRGLGKIPAPPLDVEIDDLDMDRVRRLAGAIGIDEVLDDWLARRAEASEDEEASEKFSRSLGF